MKTTLLTDLSNLNAWIERETGAKNGTPEHTAARVAVTKLLADAAGFIKAEMKEAAIENMNFSSTSIFRNAVNWTFGAIVEPLTGTDPEDFDEL